MNKNHDIKTIKLSAPNLNDVHFSKDNKLIKHCGIVNDCYVCLRPGYEGESPFINITLIGKNKEVISNLGHSGGGWTLNWSSALKAIELVDLSKIQEIAIIGGGLFGLTTAICLIEKGISPSKLTVYNETNDIKNSAGVGSGAIFSCQVKDPSVRKDFNEIILDNFKILNKIKKDNSIFNGVFPFEKINSKFYFLDFYTGHEDLEGLISCDTGLEPVVDAGLVPQIEIVKIEFENGVSHLVKKVKTYYFQVFEIMQIMQEELIRLGVNFIFNKITDLVSLKQNIIFNCTGSKSSELVADKIEFKSYSLAGHMISLNDKWADSDTKYEYILLSSYKKDKNSPSDFVVYMPKKGPGSYGVLGSTKIKDYKGGDDKIDQFYFSKIIQNLKSIFGQDKESKHNNLCPKF